VRLARTAFKNTKGAGLAAAPLDQFFGAGEMIRTPDLLITNELLYQLSYTGLLFLVSLRL
jgi:hypothetical protein